MPSPGKARPPWWIYLVAACVVTTYCLNLWNDVMGPDGVGWSRGYTLQATEVFPGGPFDKAGIRKRDVLVAVNGQRLETVLDWDVVHMNFEIGKPFTVEIQRGQQLLDFTVVIERRNSQNWGARDYLVEFAIRGAQLVLLLLAFLIVFKRPGDLGARLAAWLFSCLAAVTIPSYGLTATLHYLPAPVAVAAFAGEIFPFSGAAAWFCFFASVPRRLLTKAWHWLLALLPTAVSMTYGVIWLAPNVYSHRPMTGMISMRTFITIGIIAVLQELAGLGILIFNYFHLQEVNERRRVGVLLLGSALGWVGAMTSTLAVNDVQGLVGALLFLAFPFSFSYAILRHQLFDIRLIIRQGLQYAAARGVLLYLVPASVAVLVLDLLRHRDQTLGVVLAQRGWHYAIVIGLAFLAHSKRQRWMEALDRRFYRERYNAQQLLRETAEEIRAAASLNAVAPRVVARIEAALHPEFAALMVREARANSYRSIAIAPASAAVRDLGSDSKLMAVFRALGKPLAVSLTESSWLKQQLPHEETEFLRNARIDLLVPVSLSSEDREALLALGVKRSEEPYSGEDQELLSAIAAGLALLLERPSTPVKTKGFEECPQCGTCYDSGAGNCTVEGAKLTPTVVPRLLASRYQLEKRLGQGGMGSVYRALDMALERLVAVKLIRDDLITNKEIAERFRREAKSAAAFSHPNLVTVYDFGVDGETRAFLVMEFLQGRTLRVALQREGRMASERALRILRCVCAAMEAAHQRQLVHRDLKPENIFLVSEGAGETAKVLDFGIAKFLPRAVTDSEETLGVLETAPTAAAPSGLTTPGLLVGTPYYMSPEQLRGGPVQPAWDIWALSIIAYEMLTGAYPFAENNISECHRSILAGNFTPVSARVGGAPPSWQSFFDSAFSGDPARRPKSVAAWFDHIEHCLSSIRAHTA